MAKQKTVWIAEDGSEWLTKYEAEAQDHRISAKNDLVELGRRYCIERAEPNPEFNATGRESMHVGEDHIVDFINVNYKKIISIVQTNCGLE